MTTDGFGLYFRRWKAAEEVKTVLVCIHGRVGISEEFSAVGPVLAANGGLSTQSIVLNPHPPHIIPMRRQENLGNPLGLEPKVKCAGPRRLNLMNKDQVSCRRWLAEISTSPSLLSGRLSRTGRVFGRSGSARSPGSRHPCLSGGRLCPGRSLLARTGPAAPM
jgi:hypothetical protein